MAHLALQGIVAEARLQHRPARRQLLGSPWRGGWV